MAVIKVDENDPVGELEPSFPFRDVKIAHNVDVRDYYDLKEEIGRGKFGTVYRCLEKKSGTVLAAKFVAIAKKQDRINVEREVEIMRTLQHPRLIQIYDSFEIRNVMCVVLELIEGGELFERVIDDDFILTEKACSVFMRQICEGVSFIHANKIIHLDLKPENILCLTKTGNRIKIIDFGLARKHDPNKKLQVLFGTPEFVAPEVVNFDEITSATDMWSVGVICYVLLSGLSPFMGENDLQTMTNVTLAQYDFDDEAFDTISTEAKDFISKLLVKSKEKRLGADNCLSHPWLKRKPPPPPMFLEQSKENLKTFVDGIHTSSPFLLANCLSNGSLKNDQLPPAVPDKLKHTPEPPEKPLKPIELIPEIPPKIPQPNVLSDEQNVKLKNEINLEISNKPNILITEETTGRRRKSSESRENSFLSSGIKYDDRESIERRTLVKANSFKEFTRKSSLTVSEGSRELPRRSSLTRSEKAKNEVKRETYVSFVGPHEIKQIDFPGPENNPVEELKKFIKANIEEPTSASATNSIKENLSSNDGAKPVVKPCGEGPSAPRLVRQNPVQKEPMNDPVKPFVGDTKDLNVTCKRSNNFSTLSEVTSIIKSEETRRTTAAETSKRNSDVKPLLRPADYLQFVEKPKDNILSGLKMDVKSFESVKWSDRNLSNSVTPKGNLGNSVQIASSSVLNESSSSSNSSYVSSINDAKNLFYSSSRSQCLFELSKKQGETVSKKPDSYVPSSSIEKDKTPSARTTESFCKKSWHSNLTRNDFTLPRMSSLNNKAQENVNNSKETSSSNQTASRIRAVSLDPTSANPSTEGNQDHPFQSRFLKPSLFKSESSFKAVSETANSKYEDFRSRYSNYKELASDNDKLFRKSYVERVTPKKAEPEENKEKQEDRSQPGKNQRTSTDSHLQYSASSLNQSSSQSAGYLSRQKFRFTDQQRDVPLGYSKLNRPADSGSTSNRTDKENERLSSKLGAGKNSVNLISSQTLSYTSESKSKLPIPEKCPSNPQKSL